MNNTATLSKAETDAVLNILVEQMGVQRAQLTPDARIRSDLNADSLTVIEVILAIEEHFKITIPDERAEGINTVGDIQALLADLLREQK